MAQLQHKPKAAALEWVEKLICMLPHSGRDSTVQWISEMIYVKSNTKQMKTKCTKKKKKPKKRVVILNTLGFF